MTILQALNAYYGRMAERGEVEAPGFSREKISFVIELSESGEPSAVLDLREAKGKKAVPRLLGVPAAVKRTAGIQPNLFWDKTAYVLGRTAAEGKRTAQEHAAFKARHLELVAGGNDAGLQALGRFLEGWDPARFDADPFTPEMLDANIVFRLKGEHRFLHERPAAKALLAGPPAAGEAQAFCLVTGQRAAAQRLHPSIKGVDGAQSSGAALVSFNLDAFTSYGKEQGDNAPTSQEAAFRYGEALNRLLDRAASGNRIKIGDATVVFWADASGVGEASAAAAEDAIFSLFEPPGDETEAAKVRDALALLAKGRPTVDAFPQVQPGTRFHVLGLAPNAARLSVRFWLTDDFSAFVERLAEHHAHLSIEPVPWRTPPSIQRLLVKTTALQEKFDNIPPLLAGELARAVLSGTPYPRTWLAATIGRLRAGDDPGSGWHAAAIKAVLAREKAVRRRARGKDAAAGSEPAHDTQIPEDPPVSLDRENPSEAYQLGRLFAAMETAQYLALGRVNATIRDRYFGAASATPASVFPLLLRGVQNHLGKLRKERKGGWLEREIEEITNRLPGHLPRALKLEAQGRFVLGYYHQRRGHSATPAAAAEIEAIAADTNGED
ncbi:type I-C CRISPR-associated protein Cas8c/Csd1 [Xanthobacter oligotrophicus]|uniref:type I-C CRISPR-associated protein Cas8c/Csd1 n=1 Tax=Xanthobacter oligotrophicus TaxID=2607286 RepID=UPI0011F1E89E|nr:type I-C CRISPR-associated protein Cas8c/Csd1 [Xanthobacter oligotrophicus]MCG5234076.1 type I-C CRISPR-associated protein Cas8c/Csd1 [Xanthobacter oligotrophicus]